MPPLTLYPPPLTQPPTSTCLYPVSPPPLSSHPHARTSAAGLPGMVMAPGVSSSVTLLGAGSAAASQPVPVPIGR